MLVGTAAGNLGKDAETRQAGKDTVTSFSVATQRMVGKEKVTTWIDCSIWGKRGEGLAPYLKKGSTVSCTGELFSHEHQGKTYLKMKVDQIALLGGKRDGNSSGGSSSQSKSSTAKNNSSNDDAGDTDDIPF